MAFRHYNQIQLVLFPHTFDDLIAADHPVRIVNDILDKINLSSLIGAYRKEGNPSYHPVMMLKVMVFAYMENIYSSRKIEKAMRENVLFMGLSNMSIADHNTIARFRSQKLQSAFKDIFSQVVMLLAEEGLITLKQVYTDGTKIEAQANRYTFVWGKAIKTNKEKMLKQLEELWTYAQSVASDEDKDKEQDENYQKKYKTFSKEHLHYNQEQDFYVCPMGQRMEKTYESVKVTKTGFKQTLSHYQAKNCGGCPMRSLCHSSKNNRIIERNHNLERHKTLARKRLQSEEGIKKRKKRCYDVEPVFAHLKHNHHFKRFMLKSMKKVEIEFGLHALAHNLRKKVA